MAGIGTHTLARRPYYTENNGTGDNEPLFGVEYLVVNEPLGLLTKPGRTVRSVDVEQFSFVPADLLVVSMRAAWSPSSRGHLTLMLSEAIGEREAQVCIIDLDDRRFVRTCARTGLRYLQLGSLNGRVLRRFQHFNTRPCAFSIQLSGDDSLLHEFYLRVTLESYRPLPADAIDIITTSSVWSRNMDTVAGMNDTRGGDTRGADARGADARGADARSGLDFPRSEPIDVI
jgi:hypothetical protein